MSKTFWSSRLGFILAAAGSAVGLGNVWKFPYLAGENGGGAFVLVYLAFVFIIGAPLMIAEFSIGRASGKNVFNAYKDLAPHRSLWKWVGGLALLTSFAILAYYLVVCGWVTGYIFEALRFIFGDYETPDQAARHFNQLASNPVWSITLQAAFTAITAFIVGRGIQKGIESWCKFLMPLLGVILLVLVIWGLTLPGSNEGLIYLFKPDFSELTWHSVIMALGQAFFSLSIGMGIMITYGSYLHKNENIISTSLWIVLFDTVIALWAGIAIFSPLFTNELSPSGGPGLIFHILPVVFQNMPGGYFFGVLFFFLLAIAALTSAISMLEVPVAYLAEQKYLNRPQAAWGIAGIIFVISIPCALSFGSMSDVKWFLGKNFFEFLDFLCSNVFLPLGALLSCLFVAYVWGLTRAKEEVRKGTHLGMLLPAWGFVIKYICPLCIAIILVAKLMGA